MPDESAGCDLHDAGCFCNAGITAVARVKLYSFCGSILSEIILSFARSVIALTGVAIAEVVGGDVG